MFPSIITFVFRNFIRNFSYSLITMSSLVVGLTTAILLFLWVNFEFGYNSTLPNSNRIYALLVNELVEGELITQEGTNISLIDFFTNEVPEIESVTRIDNSLIVLTNKEKSVQKIGASADSSFFEVHPSLFVAGNSTKPFSNPHSIAISQNLADLLFGKNEALGKTILVDQKNEFTVTAVYTPFPENSSFNYIEFVLPYYAKPRASDEWVNYDIKLFDPSTRGQVEQKIDKKVAKISGNENTKSLLFPLADWRLRWNFENGKVSGGRIVYIIIFCITGLFILIMACINYMNIATARATKRSREIGVRKMTGATQRTLIWQFMTESMIITSFAAVISLLMAYILLPFFNQLIGINLSISFSDPVLLTALFGISLFTGVMAGSYPALLLSSFKPAVVLKGNLYSGVGGAGIRKALVIFQFTLSIIIIFCSLIMWQQTDYLLKKDLGYDKHRVINVWLDEDVNFSFENLKSDVLMHTSIESVAFGGASPMEVNGNAECNRVANPFVSPLLFYGVNVDDSILPMLKFEFVEGRNFSRDYASDSSNFIITQKAAEFLGFENPIGEKIRYTMFGPQEGEIIGVVKDFQNDDIHTAVKPVVFVLGKNQYLRNMFVRYRGDKVEEALEHLKTVFEKIHPGIPLNYSFFDSDFEDQLYREKMLGNISIWFTLIATTIACLGLFGLVLFNTQRRTKEIGVRKVLGATVNQVVVLLCRDFVTPVIYSFLLAFPIAWYMMQQFLESYTSRISISLISFLVVGFSMMILVLITISYQSLKAASQNPVKSLKTE